MVLEKREYKSLHQNGEAWISGEIGVIAPESKELYDYLTMFEGHEGKPVCRLGKWTKHFNNGQLAWTIEYNEYGFPAGNKFPSYRKDGTIIIT